MLRKWSKKGVSIVARRLPRSHEALRHVAFTARLAAPRVMGAEPVSSGSFVWTRQEHVGHDDAPLPYKQNTQVYTTDLAGGRRFTDSDEGQAVAASADHCPPDAKSVVQRERFLPARKQ